MVAVASPIAPAPPMESKPATSVIAPKVSVSISCDSFNASSAMPMVTVCMVAPAPLAGKVARPPPASV